MKTDEKRFIGKWLEPGNAVLIGVNGRTDTFRGVANDSATSRKLGVEPGDYNQPTVAA
jgi:hypothetical protein